MIDIITECFVPGQPRMKGSTVYVTPTYARQADRNVGDYQRLIVNAVQADRKRNDRIVAGPGVPVAVRLVFWLPRYVGAPDGEWQPTRPQSGDIDKMTRAVLDALTEAGAYGDDVQVVKLIAEQYWAPGTPGRGPGTTIQAWIQLGEQSRTDWHAANRVRETIRGMSNLRAVRE